MFSGTLAEKFASSSFFLVVSVKTIVVKGVLVLFVSWQFVLESMRHDQLINSFWFCCQDHICCDSSKKVFCSVSWFCTVKWSYGLLFGYRKSLISFSQQEKVVVLTRLASSRASGHWLLVDLFVS